MCNLCISEGGRLQDELRYVEEKLGSGAGATNEMLIQTPAVDEGGSSSVLTAEALLSHMDVLRSASRVVVEKEDV